ncbi:putative AMP-dependent synthetase/ligase, AMP-binding, ANL domain-containing protein [Helianthus annuus]|nr:putative AMP-dependent synthetase/ligase, AMP-binding, ANL domain-containing protein [Helianthus annuus]KAJ0504727.1 putative AMP-dependent synthetase/ligase, AMP-binding, ANL domain-containing protein [Helianthus annuus]KAJ0674459.1 putative AMP-dependent synthetase/ligase, AMP-binding, ANL domain-containing protein [Helianthus annuus]
MDFIHRYESKISDSKPVLAFTTSELIPKLSDSNILIVLIGSDPGIGKISKIGKIVNTLDETMKTESNRKWIKEGVTQDDTTTLLYSSGTTGASKGVISSHRNLITMVQTIHEMLSAIGRYGVTYLLLVPPILVALVNTASQIRSKYDLKTLKYVLSGGAPLSKELMEGFMEKYPGVTIMQGYGLTESTRIGASTDTVEESRR